MKILGIGNAIVDVICKVDEDYLIKNSLIKSTMKLVDEKEFKKLPCFRSYYKHSYRGRFIEL